MKKLINLQIKRFDGENPDWFELTILPEQRKLARLHATHCGIAPKLKTVIQLSREDIVRFYLDLKAGWKNKKGKAVLQDNANPSATQVIFSFDKGHCSIKGYATDRIDNKQFAIKIRLFDRRWLWSLLVRLHKSVSQIPTS